MNILIVEDDARVADFLERGLRAEGYRVRVSRDGPSGLASARDLSVELRDLDQPGVILLDLMLPIMNGMEVCQTLRASGVMTPILMLTALGGVEDRISGLRMGADDYLVKPFAFEELLARIEALMRRSRDVRATPDRKLVVGDLVLDRVTMRVSRGEREITLTARELALLELFMSAPGRLRHSTPRYPAGMPEPPDACRAVSAFRSASTLPCDRELSTAYKAPTLGHAPELLRLRHRACVDSGKCPTVTHGAIDAVWRAPQGRNSPAGGSVDIEAVDS